MDHGYERKKYKYDIPRRIVKNVDIYIFFVGLQPQCGDIYYILYINSASLKEDTLITTRYTEKVRRRYFVMNEVQYNRDLTQRKKESLIKNLPNIDI